MSTTYNREQTLVRRHGKIVQTSSDGNDATGWRDGNMEFHCHERVSGDRRSLQIAKRHWVLKESSGWSSGGGSHHTVTIKLPNKDEQLCSKPGNSGGTSVWLMKADGGYRIGPKVLR